MKCTTTVHGIGGPFTETTNVDVYFKKYYPEFSILKNVQAKKNIFERHERSCYKSNIKLTFKWSDDK